MIIDILRKLSAPVVEGASAGGSGTGDASSSGPASGHESRQAPADDDIYGKSEPGEEKPADGEQGAEGEEKPASEGGAEDFSEGDEKEVKDGEEGAEGAEGAEGEEKEEKEVKPQVLKLDPETIAAIRGEKPGQQEEKQLSPEELKKLLNPVEVTEGLIAAMRDEDPKKAAAATQSFANAIVKNAYSLMKLMVQRKEQEFQQLLGPIQQQHQQAQLAQAKNDFYTAHPHLTKYEKIVKAAAREVSGSNADGSEKSKAQIFKEVAANTVATLKSLGIQVQIKPSANLGAGGANGQVKGVVPQTNPKSPSGRSGGDNNNRQTQENDPDADIYRRGK